MGANKISAFFTPVETFFGKRVEAVERDIGLLGDSVTKALDSFDRGEVTEFPIRAASVGVDTLRVTRRFSFLAPASTAYTLIHGREEEEILFGKCAQAILRPASAVRYGLEMGVLAYASSAGIVMLDRWAQGDFDKMGGDSKEAFDHAVAKLESHIPERVIEKFQVLEHVEGRERDECWTAALRELKARGKDLPWSQIQTYSDFLGYLNEGGIFHSSRVGSVEHAVELVENRRRLSNLGRDRPIAVVVANKNDFNNAFAAKYSPLLDKLVGSGRFDVVYYEVETDRQAVAALTEVYRTSGSRISLAVFAGHGSGETIRFGGGDEEQTFLDVEDFANKHELVRELNLAIAEDGQVFLDACSTGDKRIPDNLMRVVSRALPGREIFGTSIENSLDDLKFHGSRLRDVKWDKRHREYLYTSQDDVAW